MYAVCFVCLGVCEGFGEGGWVVLRISERFSESTLYLLQNPNTSRKEQY